MSAPYRSSILDRPFDTLRVRYAGRSPLDCRGRPPLQPLRRMHYPRLKTPTLKKRVNGPGPVARDRGSLKNEPRRPASSLLELDLRADLLEGSLDLLGLFLANAFLDRLRGAFDEVLGLLEAEGGDRADFLDHFDLLVADGGEDHGELGLLLDRSGCGRSTRRRGGDA